MKDLLALTLMACVLSSVPLNAQPQSTPPTSNAPTPKHGLPERLTVGGKFRYFAHESFRPGVWALAPVWNPNEERLERVLNANRTILRH